MQSSLFKLIKQHCRDESLLLAMTPSFFELFFHLLSAGYGEFSSSRWFICSEGERARKSMLRHSLSLCHGLSWLAFSIANLCINASRFCLKLPSDSVLLLWEEAFTSLIKSRHLIITGHLRERDLIMENNRRSSRSRCQSEDRLGTAHGLRFTSEESLPTVPIVQHRIALSLQTRSLNRFYPKMYCLDGSAMSLDTNKSVGKNMTKRRCRCCRVSWKSFAIIDGLTDCDFSTRSIVYGIILLIVIATNPLRSLRIRARLPPWVNVRVNFLRESESMRGMFFHASTEFLFLLPVAAVWLFKKKRFDDKYLNDWSKKRVHDVNHHFSEGQTDEDFFQLTVWCINYVSCGNYRRCSY